MLIPQFTADDAPGVLAEALDEAGCIVVTGLLDPIGRSAIQAELAGHMDAAKVTIDDDPSKFYPGHTRRVSGLVARSATVGELILHPTSTGLCDHFLLPNGEFGYQLHVTAALEVGPGARAQVLHREHDTFTYFPQPRPNLIVATMWAISDFRQDNGATLLVPGSHRWDGERMPTEREIIPAQMPAGSVLFWLGGTLHAAGANVAQDWRYGVILTYSLGWLRQEENQYLSVPRGIAEGLSPELRDMIGYKMHRALGFAAEPTA
jgi:ectoine hydroxylase-related dioxygenase (phytanoyl-CoA dioxygenase family)